MEMLADTSGGSSMPGAMFERESGYPKRQEGGHGIIVFGLDQIEQTSILP